MSRSIGASGIQHAPLPQGALLHRYRDAGAVVDCRVVLVEGAHTLADFIRVFYASVPFRMERALLRLAAHPSTDADVLLLANDEATRFSAWTVEARTQDQVLLCDATGRTRSWLMVAPSVSEAAAATALYFGSAIVAPPGRAAGDIGFPFNVLLGPHAAYSRVLLHSAAAALRRASRRTPSP